MDKYQADQIITLLTRIAAAVEHMAIHAAPEGAPLFQPPDPWSDEDAVSGEEISNIAQEAEQLLRSVSTPEIKKDVTIGEGEPAKKLNFNIFEVERKPLVELATLWDVTADKLFQTALEFDKAVDFDLEGKVYVAAVEAVYSSIPPKNWDSPAAAGAIARLIASHNGAIP